MLRTRIGILLLLLAIDASGASDEPKIAMSVASKALIGTFKGSTACDAKVGVELRITEAAGDYRALQIKGVFKTFDLPGQPSAPVLQTPVKGEYDLQGGILSLDSYIEKETHGFSIFGAQVTRKLSGLEQLARGRDAPTREAVAKASQMALVLGRDATGAALAGTIDNNSLKCSQLSVARDDGSDSSALIAISAPVAQKQADATTNSSSRTYWLKMAADQGSHEAAGSLGTALTAGLGGAVDYAAAVKYLSVAAESGDARAQSMLSYLYGEGLGTSRDPDKSEHWRLAAEKTKLEAAKVCTAAATLVHVTDLARATAADPMAKMDNFMNMNGSEPGGDALVVRARVPQVSFVDRPFECQMVFYLIDSRTVRVPSHFDTVVRNPDGSLVQVDSNAERQIVEYRRHGTPGILNREPLVQNLEVKRQSGQQFKLTLVRSRTLQSHEYSFLVDTSDGAATPARAAP